MGLRVKLRPHRLTVRQMETCVVYVLLNSEWGGGLLGNRMCSTPGVHNAQVTRGCFAADSAVSAAKTHADDVVYC